MSHHGNETIIKISSRSDIHEWDNPLAQSAKQAIIRQMEIHGNDFHGFALIANKIIDPEDFELRLTYSGDSSQHTLGFHVYNDVEGYTVISLYIDVYVQHNMLKLSEVVF